MQEGDRVAPVDGDVHGKPVKRGFGEAENPKVSGKRALLGLEKTGTETSQADEESQPKEVGRMKEQPREDEEMRVGDTGGDQNLKPVEGEGEKQGKSEGSVIKPLVSTGRDKAKMVRVPYLESAEEEGGGETELAEYVKSSRLEKDGGNSEATWRHQPQSLENIGEGCPMSISDEFYNEGVDDMDGCVGSKEEKEDPGVKSAGEEDQKESQRGKRDGKGDKEEPGEGGTPGPGHSTRTKKKLRMLHPNKERMLEDEGSGYEDDSDERAWTGSRRSNREARYDKRFSMEPTAPPLHELPGNKEVMEDFKTWCAQKYQSKSTADTAVSSIFRRGDGKSLLEFAVRTKPDVRAEQFANFNSTSDFVLPPDPKDWIYGVFRKENDADAALQ